MCTHGKGRQLGESPIAEQMCGVPVHNPSPVHFAKESVLAASFWVRSRSIPNGLSPRIVLSLVRMMHRRDCSEELIDLGSHTFLIRPSADDTMLCCSSRMQ